MNLKNFPGESVPVSKLPATDESLRLLDLSASSVHPVLARCFLFSGTKIIRARRPQKGSDEEAVAIALVVRTGFNTTKGSLVRSMLFPKPSGFTFYRDSFRYITVMAGIALVGFFASLVNFVRLRVSFEDPRPDRDDLFTRDLACLVPHPGPSVRPHHHRSSSRPPGDLIDRDHVCPCSFEEEAGLLHQSATVGAR